MATWDEWPADWRRHVGHDGVSVEAQFWRALEWAACEDRVVEDVDTGAWVITR